MRRPNMIVVSIPSSEVIRERRINPFEVFTKTIEEPTTICSVVEPDWSEEHRLQELYRKISLIPVKRAIG